MSELLHYVVGRRIGRDWKGQDELGELDVHPTRDLKAGNRIVSDGIVVYMIAHSECYANGDDTRQ